MVELMRYLLRKTFTQETS